MSEHALHPLAHHSRFVQLSGVLPTDPAAQEHELLCRAIELGLTFDQLQGAELSCFELVARRLQMLEMKLRDKVAGSLFGGFIEEDSHIYLGTGQTRGLLMIPPGTGGVCFRCAGKGDGSCQGASKIPRGTNRRAARRRQEEMTEPGEKGLGGLLAESVQQVARPFSRELLPLPIPFPENEEVESEQMRGLSRAVRSRVKRRVGWQGWASAGMRGVNGIFSKTSASEAGSRASAMQLTLCHEFAMLVRGKALSNAIFCRGSLQSALRFCAWLHWKWCQTGHLQGGSRFPARPRCEDGRWLCSFDWLGL